MPTPDPNTGLYDIGLMIDDSMSRAVPDIRKSDFVWRDAQGEPFIEVTRGGGDSGTWTELAANPDYRPGGYYFTQEALSRLGPEWTNRDVDTVSWDVGAGGRDTTIPFSRFFDFTTGQMPLNTGASINPYTGQREYGSWTTLDNKEVFTPWTPGTREAADKAFNDFWARPTLQATVKTDKKGGTNVIWERQGDTFVPREISNEFYWNTNDNSNRNALLAMGALAAGGLGYSYLNPEFATAAAGTAAGAAPGAASGAYLPGELGSGLYGGIGGGEIATGELGSGLYGGLSEVALGPTAATIGPGAGIVGLGDLAGAAGGIAAPVVGPAVVGPAAGASGGSLLGTIASGANTVAGALNDYSGLIGLGLAGAGAAGALTSDAPDSTAEQYTGDLWKYWNDTFRPVEAKYASDVMNFDSPAEVERRAGMAAATTQAQIDAQRAAAMRQAGRMGLSPERTAQQMIDDSNAAALAKAGAVNKERNDSQLAGIGLRGQAAQIGQTYPRLAVAGTAGADAAALAQYNSRLGAYGDLFGAGLNLLMPDNKNKNKGEVDEGWNVLTSDENKKENIRTVDEEAVLDGLSAIPVSRFDYKAGVEDGGTHLGPMAQDVHAQFGERAAPGGTTIDPVTMNGLTLAAVKGLTKKVARIERALKQNDGGVRDDYKSDMPSLSMIGLEEI